MAAAAEAETKIHFDIEAQTLSKALQVFGVQASRQVLFAPNIVAGKRSESVVGDLGIDAALTRLLAGSNLTFSSANGTILIIEADPTPPKNTSGSLAPSVQTASSAEAGGAGGATVAAGPTGKLDTSLDEIIVTGTHQTSRTVTTSLAPIDVISAADLEKSGNESVRDLIAAVTPSANVSNSGAGASFAVKTLSLRGLSSDQTLILVNGKRRHDTSMMFINGSTQNGQSPADLDLIPTSAIDHIEVLRDGAAVQYGSDALAGVVNIILKKDRPGGITLSGGMTAEGDGKRGDVSIDQGWSIGQGGTLHLSTDIYGQGRTVRGGQYTGQIYPLVNGQPDPREATVDRFINKPGQPQTTRYDGSYDLTLPVSDTVTLYSFSTIASRGSNSWLTYRNPAGSNNVLSLYPNGYIPRLDLDDLDYQVAAGFKGDGPWGVHWDLSSTYGEDKVKYREHSDLNVTYGAASPTEFYLGSTDAQEWTTNLDLSRDLTTGIFAEPLFISAGAEYRQNHYSISPGDYASYANGGSGLISGAQGVTGFPPSLSGSWSRENESVYFGIDQTVIKGLDVSAAGRYEHYSDFGDTTNAKGSMRYEPIDGYAIRGTISTGFRAPTLAQEHYASSSTIGVTRVGYPTTPYPVQTLPPDSAAARALGATALKPEQSTNYSIGFIAEPISNLTFSADAYEIQIKDRILLSATLLGTPVSNALAAAGLNPQQGGFFFTNAADTTTTGLDLVANYLTRFDEWGTVKWGASANFNHTSFDRITAPPTALAAAGLVLIDRARQGDFTKGTPANKFILDADWNLGDFESFIRVTRYGAVTAVNATGPALDEKANARFIVDLNLSYDISDGVRGTIGADNLLNTYPSVVRAINQSNGAQYYNAYSPFGISGGYYYAKLNYKF